MFWVTKPQTAVTYCEQCHVSLGPVWDTPIESRHQGHCPVEKLTPEMKSWLCVARAEWKPKSPSETRTGEDRKTRLTAEAGLWSMMRSSSRKGSRFHFLHICKENLGTPILKQCWTGSQRRNMNSRWLVFSFSCFINTLWVSAIGQEWFLLSGLEIWIMQLARV